MSTSHMKKLRLNGVKQFAHDPLKSEVGNVGIILTASSPSRPLNTSHCKILARLSLSYFSNSVNFFLCHSFNHHIDSVTTICHLGYGCILLLGSSQLKYSSPATHCTAATVNFPKWRQILELWVVDGLKNSILFFIILMIGIIIHVVPSSSEGSKS